MYVKKIMFSLATGAILFTSIAPAAFAAPNVIVNGSFENGTAPGTFLTVFAPNNTTISNWTVSKNNIDYIGSYWTAADGMRSIDMNGVAPGTISQSFPTLVGYNYHVGFAMSGNPACGPAVKTMDVSAGSRSTTTSYLYNNSVTNNTLTNMEWQNQTYNFVATGNATTLTFTSTTQNSNCGPALDNVSAAPNPASFADCKNYQDFVDANGKTLSSQVACIVYVSQHLHRTDGNVTYGSNPVQHGQWGVGNDGTGLDSAVGAFSYTDSSHNWIVANIKLLSTNANMAWFAGPVISSSIPGLVSTNQWVVVQAIEDSQDKIGVTFADQTTATSDVLTMTSSVIPSTVTSGNITVH